jgi:acyl-coenzyme A thioesterase PaaI-like protein
MTEIKSDSGAAAVLRWWSRLAPLPAGRYLFSIALGLFIPYTGSIRARVEELRPGYARLVMTDRRRVRNHLNSVHAVALLNLGEVTSGLAVFSALSANMRGILTEIHAQYLKKARGRLTARAEFRAPDLPAANGDETCEVEAFIEDSTGDTVSIVRAAWLIGYKPS